MMNKKIYVCVYPYTVYRIPYVPKKKSYVSPFLSLLFSLFIAALSRRRLKTTFPKNDINHHGR